MSCKAPPIKAVLQGMRVSVSVYHHGDASHLQGYLCLPALLLQNPSNVHLLKLYESGLPAWAVVLPAYGLWYRPWLRRVVSCCTCARTRACMHEHRVPVFKRLWGQANHRC
jgi:hypothetical protein